MAVVPLVLADRYNGNDIGAQIMAAHADLGSLHGIIVVPHSTTKRSIDTQIVLHGGGGRKLILGDGEYDNSMTAGPPILLGDDCEIVSSRRWGAKVYETVNRPSQGNTTSAIQDYGSSLDTSGPGSVNISVRGLSFLPKAETLDSISGTVIVGNAKDVIVEDCYFYRTSGFCMSAGGGGSVDGNYAENIRFERNTMIEAGTQNIACVNGRQVFILDNYMKSGGGGGRGQSTFIDCECNTETDYMEDVTIARNIIDARGGHPFSGATGIAVLGGGTQSDGRVQHIQILDNQILAGPDGVSQYYLGNGVVCSRGRNITVARNRIFGVSQAGITIELCVNATVEHNDLIDCVGANDAIQTQIYFLYTQKSVARFNNLINQSGASNFEQGITEADDSDLGAACDHNKFYGNRVIHVGVDTLHEARIKLTGPNSRAWSNSFNDEMLDGSGGVSTCAALATMPSPGGRASGQPALARVLGYLSVGDAPARTFVFDPASTATHNGITVIKPQNLSGGDLGRWIVVPSQIQMTTTTRDALTLTSADAGLAIFNTTAGKSQEWDGSAWQNLW